MQPNRDRTFEVQRLDVYQMGLNPFQDYQFTILTNYKQNAEWTWSEDKSGKITGCSKRPGGPGPQPTGSDCIVRDPAAVRRGTCVFTVFRAALYGSTLSPQAHVNPRRQGPLEVTFFEGDMGGNPYNTTCTFVRARIENATLS